MKKIMSLLEKKVQDRYVNRMGIFMVFILFFVDIFFFLKRVIYPDSAFDSINYHFFLGKNGFDNFPFPFGSDEFFPLGMYGFNPIVDMFGYISYLFFGFRLGTILSALSLMGTIFFGYVLLKKFLLRISFNWVSLAVFILLIIPIFTVQEALFQLATYYTDDLYVLILMMSVGLLFIFLNTKKDSWKELYITLLFGFFSGLAMTKLTNFIYIFPFFCVFAYILYAKYSHKWSNSGKRVLCLVFAYGIMILALNAFILFNEKYSGNPFFPYYNSIFKSEYYPEKNWSFNFGPTTLVERILYPVYAIQNPKLLGEVKDSFPDRKLLVIFFYVLISTIVLYRKKEEYTEYEKLSLFLFFSSFFFWQIQFGYSRYGIFLEIFGGMISLAFAVKIFSKPFIFLKFLTVVFLFYMLAQSVAIYEFNYKYDMSWRPTSTLDQWWKGMTSKNFFDKYTRLNKATAQQVRNADIVIQCTNPSSLYFSTIKELKDLPMVNIDKGSNVDLTTNEEYKKKRDEKIFLSVAQKRGRDDKSSLNFVSVMNKIPGSDGKGSEGGCLRAIERENENVKKIEIIKRDTVDNYIGDKDFSLIILYGKYYE